MHSVNFHSSKRGLLESSRHRRQLLQRSGNGRARSRGTAKRRVKSGLFFLESQHIIHRPLTLSMMRALSLVCSSYKHCVKSRLFFLESQRITHRGARSILSHAAASSSSRLLLLLSLSSSSSCAILSPALSVPRPLALPRCASLRLFLSRSPLSRSLAPPLARSSSRAPCW